MYEVSKGKQIVFKRKMEIKQKYSASNGILYQTNRNEPEINFPTYVYFTFIYENKRFCTYSKLIGKFLLSCFRYGHVLYFEWGYILFFIWNITVTIFYIFDCMTKFLNIFYTIQVFIWYKYLNIVLFLEVYFFMKNPERLVQIVLFNMSRWNSAFALSGSLKTFQPGQEENFKVVRKQVRLLLRVNFLRVNSRECTPLIGPQIEPCDVGGRGTKKLVLIIGVTNT